MNVPVSVLILTLDEQLNLPRCLASLAWCDDVVILDSGSKDKTSEIAIDAGARVFERQFDNYAAQRNFGLKNITYKNPWLLMVDADEEVPPVLVEEIAEVMAADDDRNTMYRLRRKDHFLGKWIRRSSGYPTWFGRLVRPDCVHVEREINEEFITDGQVGLLEQHLNHYPFSKGLSAWLDKHNRYSTMEARLMVEGGLCSVSMADLVSSDPACRRRGVKAIVYRLPFRPLWMFFALFIIRGGLLDGRAGFVFCVLRAFYEFLINCKIQELKQHSEKKSL